MTIKHIARLAGVSKATVSRVIHSPHLVRPSTRRKIERIMSETRYIYNVHAADFSRAKTSMIGIILPTTRGSIYAEQIEGMQEKLRGSKYSLLIGHNNHSVDTELELLTLFIQRRLAGIVLTGLKPQTLDLVRHAQQIGIPCTVAWEETENRDISYVGFDNFSAAYRITEYLVGLGHKEVGLIMGPYSTVQRVRRRFEGFRAAIEDAGLVFNPDLTVETGITLHGGREAMTRLLSARGRPTAVFAASDVLAFGAISAAVGQGLKVPEDVSVAGFDDTDFAPYCGPPLTTVRVPVRRIGELTAEVLLEAIGGKHPATRRHRLETQIVARESCAPPLMAANTG